MSTPNTELSAYAPKLTTIQIPVETIGAVIGPGGEMIRSIVKETGAEINIDDDGTITIAAVNQESADAAIARIRDITKPIELDSIIKGKVKEIREGLGAFIELKPKKEGLLHISQIDYKRVENVADVLKVGDIIEVKVVEVQPDGKIRLSRKALLPVPEGMEAEEYVPRGPRPGGDRFGGDRGGRGGDRGGRGGDRGGDRGGRGGDRGGDRGGRSFDRDRGPRGDRDRGDRGPRPERGHDDRPDRGGDEPRQERPRGNDGDGGGDFFVG
jgi:polyribonucleotide nucleotidyltransferase